jgi:hypothetical protein
MKVLPTYLCTDYGTVAGGLQNPIGLRQASPQAPASAAPPQRCARCYAKPDRFLPAEVGRPRGPPLPDQLSGQGDEW